jgi:predicted aminopeptidase
LDALTQRARPRWGRLLKRILLIGLATVAGGAVLLLIVSADARYIARAGIEEGRLLLRRRAIAKLIADSATPAALRQRFALVLAARAYAADSLGLAVGTTYTSYVDVGRDGEADRLDAEGLDVFLRPSGAFSTLGYFSDPLFSTAMSRDTMELVATVIHELAHNTLYVKSQTPFNESFASFVGYRGAEAFFRARHDSLDAKRAAARWRDERTLDVFYAELARRLDSAYAEPLSGARLEQVRTQLFGWAHDQFRGAVGQSLETYDWRWFAQAPLNNAVIIAERLYRMDLNLFDEIYLQNNADIAETIRAIQIRVFTQPGDPYQALYSRPGMKVEED